MNDLEQFFFNKDHRMIHKWRHYFEIYDKHFQPHAAAIKLIYLK